MQDYLGRRGPKHTAYYTRVAERRFQGLWRWHCRRACLARTDYATKCHEFGYATGEQ
jgi:hypothetical protein